MARALAVLLLFGDVDPKDVPPELKDNYDTFRVRCSKCHTLAKPYSVKQTHDGWRRYIEKMKRKSGSGINAENGAKILAFLVWLEDHRDAPQTSPSPEADGGVP
jgi:hypothetical protein